jgi:hypothetical protein
MVWLALSSGAAAQWTLTDAERREFLNFYAPLILKRGNEDEGFHGRDWISNYDFDGDFVFGDNKREWRALRSYIDAGAVNAPNAQYANWQIRPTLYAGVIEYMDGGQKHLVLLYQIYHAMQESVLQNARIHDFERVEIHIRNVSTTRRPNAGESAAFAVITQHNNNVMRALGSPDYNFLDSGTGRHLLLWQAEWNAKYTGAHGHELRFVEDRASTILSRMASNANAEVNIIGDSGDNNVHYAFVPEASATAVSQFAARAINYTNATTLASRRDNGDDINWASVKRVTYELQDLADIYPTSWSGAAYTPHWTTNASAAIRVVDPVSIPRGASIPAGVQTFFISTRDEEFGGEEKNYLGRNWFWGTYEFRDVCDPPNCNFSALSGFNDSAFSGAARDSRGVSRQSANGDPASAGAYWSQHDYFVHSGIVDSRDGFENGFFLTAGWHLPSRGGFDGRWTSLFDDRRSTASSPLALSIRRPPPACSEVGRYTATASGGVQPYTFSWATNGAVAATQSGVSSSTQTLAAYSTYTVTVVDNAGMSRDVVVEHVPDCGGGEVLQ